MMGSTGTNGTGIDMIARVAALTAGLSAAAVAGLPAAAQDMSAEQARRFVVGKMFAFTCFEGTSGAGRVYADGSVAGTIRLRGDGPVRYVRLPADTLRIKGERVCASMKGLPFEPCFNLTQTDNRSFRGSLWGLGFAYCDFVRRGGRTEMARAGNNPMPIQSATSKDDD
jgi:hypothetical protein